MVLVQDKYYVVVGKSVNKTREEQVMVQFHGVQTKPDEYSSKIEKRFIFEIVAYLTDCDEGVPGIGEIEEVKEEDLKTMNDEGFYFREPTQTELVLFGQPTKT